MTAARPATKRIGAILMTAAATALVAWLVVANLRPHHFSGTVIQSMTPSPDFSLRSADGPIALSDFRGELVLLFFGYTHCPDVCPTTLADVAGALERLEDDASQVQLIMISVDPDRDTPDQLAEYVGRFDPDFVGLTGTHEEIAEVAGLYGVWFESEEGTRSPHHLVSHTSTLYVIDRDRQLQLLIPHGVGSDAIAEDLAHLLG